MNIGIVIGLIKALAPGVDPAVIEQAVTDWLDDHPEATTTVQDGSITEEKLAQDVLAELGEIEELKEAIENVDDILAIQEASAPSKNLNVTPYHSEEVNDITFTVNADGTVEITGTPSKNTWWPDLRVTSFRWPIAAGTYTWYAGEDSNNWRSPTLIIYATEDASSGTEYALGSYGHMQETITIANDSWAGVRFFIDGRNTSMNYKFYPQVEAGSVATSYESPWATESEAVSLELETRSKPKPLIVDADLGGDSDDAMAVRVLSYYDAIGTIRLLMASCSYNSINAIKGMSAMLEYDGTLNVPVVLRDSNYSEATGNYLDVLITYPFSQSTPKTVYGATAFRKALAAAKEKVNLLFLGQLTNLSDLLDSSADSFSTKTGMELVAEKVDKIYIMGGAYPDSVEAMDGEGATVNGVKVPGAEWNFAGDISATDNVIDNCPVPMIFCGWEIGRALPVGGGISAKLPANDAMIAVMNKHGGSSEVTNGRYGYDPFTAVIACLDNAEKFGFELVRGTVVYDSTDSTNTFTESASGNHYYVAKKYDNDYYQMLMNHILAKDWWGANNAAQNGRAKL